MTSSGPVWRTIRSAHVQAAERPAGKFHGGVVLGDDPESLLLRHNRSGRVVDHFAAEMADPVKLPGSYAYLGRSFGHFGHIMSEMIHRILPTRQIVSDPNWLILQPKGSPARFSALAPAARMMLGLLGVDESNCTVIAQDAIVEELLIVEAGSDLGSEPKDWYLELLRENGPGVVARNASYPRKVYVSRAGLEDKSGFLGEQVLENVLADAGFHIMRSEQLSLTDQFAHYANADVLLFAEGSACHGLEMFGGNTLAHTILMNRRPPAATAFHRVLEPRSRQFDHFSRNPFFGTAVFNGRGDARADRGVSAIAMHDLAEFLDEIGVAEIERVPALAYIAAAHADLERYIERAVAQTRRLQPELLGRQEELIERLHDTFAAAVQAGGRIASARPGGGGGQRAREASAPATPVAPRAAGHASGVVGAGRPQRPVGPGRAGEAGRTANAQGGAVRPAGAVAPSGSRAGGGVGAERPAGAARAAGPAGQAARPGRPDAAGGRPVGGARAGAVAAGQGARAQRPGAAAGPTSAERVNPGAGQRPRPGPLNGGPGGERMVAGQPNNGDGPGAAQRGGPARPQRAIPAERPVRPGRPALSRPAAGGTAQDKTD